MKRNQNKSILRRNETKQNILVLNTPSVGPDSPS